MSDNMPSVSTSILIVGTCSFFFFSVSQPAATHSIYISLNTYDEESGGNVGVLMMLLMVMMSPGRSKSDGFMRRLLPGNCSDHHHESRDLTIQGDTCFFFLIRRGVLSAIGIPYHIGEADFAGATPATGRPSARVF